MLTHTCSIAAVEQCFSLTANQPQPAYKLKKNSLPKRAIIYYVRAIIYYVRVPQIEYHVIII
jgi:hypothetical protein